MRWGAALLLVAFATGCGGSGDDGEGLTVYAASSLTEVFQELDPGHRYNFAGSDELATQIREGGAADLYAAASPRYPEELREDGLVGEPRVFATNQLVLIVPDENPRVIQTVADLGRPGTKLVIGAQGVPVGDYTRDVLAELGLSRVLERVVSEEENVKGVVGKVALGEADAGFVYATDARAAGDDVRAIDLPRAAAIDIRYPIAVVESTGRRDDAEAFVERLLGPEGREALAAAGFGLP
ncbi:MAG TPA: molybdate ABC transporter substrate-binding protein [Gaiellaceae bacterium]|nr:molybdate ABC transporter substrate-binding protein [Gaiellaceae bacterium]